MKDIPLNPKDLEIWNGIFAQVPADWRTAPPSAAMEACASWLRQAQARTVLDLGCGMGRWTVWLQRQGFETAGADFAPNGIRYGRAWAAEEGLEIPLECAPVTGRPSPERQFDAVVAALVLDLVSPAEFAAALEVVRDSLRAAGHLFAVFNPAERPTGTETEGNPTAGITQINYSDDQIRDRLAAAGFLLLRRENSELETRGFLWQLAPTRRPRSDT